MNTLPSCYKPSAPKHFIGSARKAAVMLQNLFKQADGAPLKILLLGEPGIGKSALVDWILEQIEIDQWSSEKFNGTGFKIEQAAELEKSFHLRSLYADRYRVIRIEEVDKVPHAAQVRLLTALDDLPKNTLFIATSNCEAKDLEERFHSRFMVLPIKAPTPDEIAGLINANWNLPITTVTNIAEMCCGNVRQALLDVQTASLQAA
jgi:replication-associated recombination protein RarA